jgi:cell division protein FtsI (penicillin-binding protein 3)
MDQAEDNETPPAAPATAVTSCCASGITSRPVTPNPHRTCRGWQKIEGADPAARLRIGLIFGGLLALYGGLSLRLFQIQVGQGAKWKKQSDDQKVFCETVQPQRGPITDQTGLPVAFCLPRDTVIADFKILKDETAAEKLAPLLKIPVDVLRKKLTPEYDEDGDLVKRVVYLARDIEEEVADKIRALKIRGIGFEDSFRRTYPQGPLACHVIGWSGIDGGKEGLELGLNSILSGTPGYLRYYRDAAKRLIALNDGAIGPSDSKPPNEGLSVTLTLDARVQQTAEEELAHIHEQFQPKSATCVVIDVSTGAILALACTPGYDPNKPSSGGDDARRNRVICDIYEPGSTFKTFAAAMSLEKKLWRRNELIDCENGAWNLGYRTLHDAHAYGTLSFDDVIAKSSNIGAAKIGMRLGVGGLYDMVKTFGFGDPTGVNLPGEIRGRVRNRKVWSNDSVYSVSMGHEVGVTPIQLAAAYASVVNGGVLYRPKIVQRITNEKGEELYSLHPQAVRRVISEQTSAQMREVLTRVVAPGGTGFKAFCAEWPIGGKTGTTKKIDPVTKTYSNTLYIGSFCGFAPANNPRLVCLVTVDEPHKGSGYYGGTVACPAVREVLRKGLTVLNVPARSADEQKKVIEEVKRVAAK